MGTEYRLRNKATGHELILMTHASDTLEQAMERGGHNEDKFELVETKTIELKKVNDDG